MMTMAIPPPTILNIVPRESSCPPPSSPVLFTVDQLRAHNSVVGAHIISMFHAIHCIFSYIYYIITLLASLRIVLLTYTTKEIFLYLPPFYMTSIFLRRFKIAVQ